MPEQGVMFNVSELPPREYLMRRSWNPNDAEIPGAIVRQWTCGRDHPRSIIAKPYNAFVCPQGHPVHPHAVDVPLLKENGERWQ